MKGAYDDIIDLPRHVSLTRPRMPRENRAAQFSPFAALTGYDAAVAEEARRTQPRPELSEDAVRALEKKLNALAERIGERPVVTVTHFLPDSAKEGGAHVVTTGAVKKIDDRERAVVLEGGERIAIADILDLCLCREMSGS
jgi:predicted secreted protein